MNTKSQINTTIVHWSFYKHWEGSRIRAFGRRMEKLLNQFRRPSNNERQLTHHLPQMDCKWGIVQIYGGKELEWRGGANMAALHIIWRDCGVVKIDTSVLMASSIHTKTLDMAEQMIDPFHGFTSAISIFLNKSDSALIFFHTLSLQHWEKKWLISDEFFFECDD